MLNNLFENFSVSLLVKLFIFNCQTILFYYTFDRKYLHLESKERFDINNLVWLSL